MFSINGTQINLTRGDTARFNVDIVDENGSPFTFSIGDRLTLTVKKTTTDPNVLFQIVNEKDATNSIEVFHIEPSHTSPMDFGSYKYDIQLTLVSGDNYTIIPPSTILITEEVGW